MRGTTESGISYIVAQVSGQYCATWWEPSKPAHHSYDMELIPKEIRKIINKCNLKDITSPGLIANHIPGIHNIVKHPLRHTCSTYQQTIIDLNDGYHWSREQIADWLDTCDNAPAFRMGE